MWLLNLLFSFFLLGCVLVLLVATDSVILNWLERRNYYFVFHVVFCFYSLLLGAYGRTLRERSFERTLSSLGVDFAPAASKVKVEVFADLKRETSGRKTPVSILEIGAGPGVNFDYYPDKCDVTVVEPVALFKKSIENKLKLRPGIRLKNYIETTAEQMNIVEDNSMDVVLSTEVLCSVENPKLVLEQIFRVLKPGGKYYFFEHIVDKSRSGSLRRLIQDFLNTTGLWSMWFMGCEFRDTPVRFDEVPFSDVKGRLVDLVYTVSSLPLHLCAPHYCGQAHKGA